MYFESKEKLSKSKKKELDKFQRVLEFAINLGFQVVGFGIRDRQFSNYTVLLAQQPGVTVSM